MHTENINETLSFREKVGFGCGDFASNLFFMVFTMYGLYFYTDVFGISAAIVGSIFLVARIWDAVNDPIMGLIADRTRSRWGSFRPYLLWMAIPYGVIGYACFIVPDWGSSAKIFYAAATYILFGMIYTAINLPYSGLMAVISPNSLERTKVASFRFIGANLGGLVVALCIPLLVEYFGAGNEQVGYKLTMGLLACIATILFLITFITTRERVEPPAGQSSSPLKDAADLCCNKPCILLFFIGLLGLASFSVHLAAVPFYFKYYMHGAHQVLGWQLESHELISVFFTLGTICALIGILATKHIVALFGKVAAYIILMALAAAFTLPQYYLGPDNVSTLLVLQGLSALFGGPVAPIVFSMYADAADYSEHRTGRRATGLVMSFASFGMKFGWAIGGALGGWLLAWSGYIPDQQQTPEAIHGILLMLGLIPAVLGLCACALMFFHPLTDNRMSDIGAELARRRAIAIVPA